MAQSLEEKMESQGYLKVSRAAEKLGVSVYTIYRWIKAGTLDGEKVIGHWFVTIDSLIAKANSTSPDGARKAGLIEGDPNALESAQPHGNG